MAFWEYLWAWPSTTKWLYHLNWNSNDSSGNWNNWTDTWVNYGIWYWRFWQWVTILNNFDTRTQYISLPTSIMTENMSICFRARTSASTSKRYMLPFDYESGGKVYWRITFGSESGSPNKVESKIWATTPTAAITWDILLRNNTRQFRAFTRSKSWSTYTAKIYLNWNPVPVATASANSTNTESIWVSPTIWASSFAWWWFTWDIDEFVVISKELTPAEIQKIYTFSKWRFWIT